MGSLSQTRQTTIPAKHPNRCLYALEVADSAALANASLNLRTVSVSVKYKNSRNKPGSVVRYEDWGKWEATQNARIPDKNLVQLSDIATENRGKQPKNTKNPDTTLFSCSI